MASPVFPLIGFSRHRMATDGQGVTSLAAAWGCPLRCKLCLNPQCWRKDARIMRVTPEELYELARADDLYFQATGGGVTFGGGEPLLRSDFIRAFRRLCGSHWRLTAETCLNVPEENLSEVVDSLDEYLVDIKDMNPDVYRRYTGGENAKVIDNLRLLLESVGPDRVIVRVPNIPGFNTRAEVDASVQTLRDMGVQRLDVFDYVVR